MTDKELQKYKSEFKIIVYIKSEIEKAKKNIKTLCAYDKNDSHKTAILRRMDQLAELRKSFKEKLNGIEYNYMMSSLQKATLLSKRKNKEKFNQFNPFNKTENMGTETITIDIKVIKDLQDGYVEIIKSIKKYPESFKDGAENHYNQMLNLLNTLLLHCTPRDPWSENNPTTECTHDELMIRLKKEVEHLHVKNKRLDDICCRSVFALQGYAKQNMIPNEKYCNDLVIEYTNF